MRLLPWRKALATVIAPRPSWRASLLWLTFPLLFLSGCNPLGSKTADILEPESQPGDRLALFQTRRIGDPYTTPPRISFVKIVDLDQDGLPDVLVCDCVANTVSWIRQTSEGQFQESVLADQLVAPARVECVDFEGDGDLDLFVAVLGKLFPSNERIGSLVALENIGNNQFERRVLLEGVARVSDVRAGDLDQDDDLDLVVTHFGYDEGETQWLENQGAWKFSPHPLQALSGGIHGVVSDMNNDSFADVVLLISQEHEKLYVFDGDGTGSFVEREVYAASSPDFGSAGITVVDLDQDGDQDVLYCNGDAFDYAPPRPWPWHGVQWLENLGRGRFRYRRLLDFGGAVNARAGDYDSDGDLDVFISSAFNDWDTPESNSLMVLENTGSMKFVSHPLANSPSHIQAIDIGDLNGDGKLDLVSGGMHISSPYDRVERVVLWEAQ